MAYDVLDVSRYIINYSNKNKYSISNLKLQKLLYFVQAYFLITKDAPCFDAKIEAWDFGPVVPIAYHEFKQYGSGEIPEIKSYLVFDSNDVWNTVSKPFNEDVISSEDREFIGKVVKQFSKYTASSLVELTHRQAPWKDVFEVGKNREITLQSIKNYFNE